MDRQMVGRGLLDAAGVFDRVLRRFRLGAGLTQEQLGLEADQRRTYVSILELGHSKLGLTAHTKRTWEVKQQLQSRSAI